MKDVVQPGGIIHCVYAGEVGFKGTGHLVNFIKYLFGAKSGRHVINEHTKNNVFTEDIENDAAFLFSEDPAVLYNNFTRKYSEEFKDFSSFRNDVFYVPFLLEINGRLVSNFLDIENDEIVISLQDGDGEGIMNAMGKEYLNGIDGLFAKADDMLAKYGQEFTKYNDCLGSERMELEKLIHKSCAKEVSKDFILSISHDDQFESHPTYHMHRMYRIEEKPSFSGIQSIL